MENSHKYFENRDCKYYPCHEGIEEMNCLFCYCPMYHLDDCPGDPSYKERDGRKIKVCIACTFPHEPDNYDRVIETIREGTGRR